MAYRYAQANMQKYGNTYKSGFDFMTMSQPVADPAVFAAGKKCS